MDSKNDFKYIGINFSAIITFLVIAIGGAFVDTYLIKEAHYIWGVIIGCFSYAAFSNSFVELTKEEAERFEKEMEEYDE